MKMLVTVQITKGFDTWVEMSKKTSVEGAKHGIRMVWAGTNPAEDRVYVVVEMQDPSQMKTFGEREDIAKMRADAGAIVESTEVISPIGRDFMPDA